MAGKTMGKVGGELVNPCMHDCMHSCKRGDISTRGRLKGHELLRSCQHQGGASKRRAACIARTARCQGTLRLRSDWDAPFQAALPVSPPS